MNILLSSDFTIPGFDDVVSTVRSFTSRSANDSRPMDGASGLGDKHTLMAPYQRCWLCGPPYSGKARALRLLAEQLGVGVSLFVDATALAPGSPASAEVASYLEGARGSAEPRVLLIANGHRAPEPHRDSTPLETEVADDPGKEYVARPPDQEVGPRHSEPGVDADRHASQRRTRVSQRQWRTGRRADEWSDGPVAKIADRIAREALPVLLVVSSDEDPPLLATGVRKPFDTVLRSYLPRKSALKEIWTKVLSGVATDESVNIAALVNLSVGYTANEIAMTLEAAIREARLHQGKPVDELCLSQIDLLGAIEVSPLTIREWERDRPEENSMHKHLSAALAERHPDLAMKPKAHPRDVRYVRRGIRERRENLRSAMHEEMDRIRATWNEVQLKELHMDQ